MPFDQQTKCRMFIRCGRLCCLCLKQCGINIEAAHIVDEGKGGSNEESNGIPVCLDCHAEIGSYNSDHPRGNKFTAKELRARRDRLYGLVASGLIYAQIIAVQLSRSSGERQPAEIPAEVPAGAPSREGRKFLAQLLEQREGASAPGDKLNLLSPIDRAHVLDALIDRVESDPSAVSILGAFASAGVLDDKEKRIVLDRVVRGVTMTGTLSTKIAVLRSLDEDTLAEAGEDIRHTFFREVIDIIKRDQFTEVNPLVPALAGHFKDVPADLHSEYVLSMLDQSCSSSYAGAPAAVLLLRSLPKEMIQVAVPGIDTMFLCVNSGKKHLKNLIREWCQWAKGAQQTMLQEFVDLPAREFMAKYDPY